MKRESIGYRRVASRALGDALGLPDDSRPALLRLRSLARQEVAAALAMANGNITEAAGHLGAHRGALHRWLARWPELRSAPLRRPEESTEHVTDDPAEIPVPESADKHIQTMAHASVRRGILSGEIVRGTTCGRCGKSPCSTDAHHWSYDREHWTDVIWLCLSCHSIVHQRAKRGPDDVSSGIS